MTEPKASVVWPIIQSHLQYENMVMLRARLCLNCCRKIRPNKNITNREGGLASLHSEPTPVSHVYSQELS